MLEIVVCEDNEEYRKIISTHLEAIIREQKINGALVLTCACPHEVEAFMTVKNPNVFFLDIDLNCQTNGLDLASLIHQKNENTYIVFISQYTNLVFKSFKVRPFDFLPKPVTKKDLATVLLEINDDYLKRANSQRPDLFSIKIGNKIHQLPKDHIIFLEKFGNKCIVHTTTKTIYCYQSLEAIYEKLANENFIRCHKSFIVNKNYIEQTNLTDMEIILSDGQKCFIGGKYKKNLMGILDNSQNA